MHCSVRKEVAQLYSTAKQIDVCCVDDSPSHSAEREVTPASNVHAYI
jgi:hypothetical protein